MSNYRIYKFLLESIDGFQTVLMPVGPGFGEPEVLSFGLDPQGYHQLCIWASIIPHEIATRARVLYLAPTGGQPPDCDSRFINTTNDANYIVHCWDCGWKKL
jgi:hypothetical protein